VIPVANINPRSVRTNSGAATNVRNSLRETPFTT